MPDGEPALAHSLTLSLAALRRGYAAGQLSVTRVAETVLSRIAERGDDAVWISQVSAEELRARAAELDAIRDRLPDLPLFGIPFAVKDNIDVAGLPTTAACPDFAYRPGRTAPVVQRLIDAGALMVGKTNLDQFATGLTGSRTPYGRGESVFGGGLISGGSSSGSAVAVAAGLVAFALGTDTAGSGRVPAALNGIVGVKPSRGLLSTAGVVPACRSLDCVSIFAPDVLEAGTVLQVARGCSADDPWGRPLPADRAIPRMPATLRLGVPQAEDLEFFGDDGQRDRFAAGQAGVAELVASTVPVELGPLLAAGDLLYKGPWVAERLAGLDDFIREHAGSLLPVTRTVLEGGRRYSAVDAFKAQHRLQELRAWTDRLFQRIDVLVLPTIGTTYTLDEIAEDPLGRNLNLGRYTQFANLLDLAVVTIPNGFTREGRPASISLIGPAFSDATVARLAAELPGLDAATPTADTITLGVVGRHLSGESHNGELVDRGGVLLEVTRTAPIYRFYRLAGGLPGLVRTPSRSDGPPGVPIEVELWQLPAAAIGGLLAGVPAPLSLGWLRLADDREVLGFLCEAYAAGPEAEDISASGGWRAYRMSSVWRST